MRESIESAAWFSRLGEFAGEPGRLAIRSLEVWADEEAVSDRHHRGVAEEMEWLPAQAQDPDPIRPELTDSDVALGFYKQALAALRSLNAKPLLKVGKHDFQHVAVGAAAYACRRAAVEVEAEEPGFWCGLVGLYAAGFWPCGVLPDGTVVVL
ncbi:MAG: hypothetical protein J0I12_17570 [Candidatus Eremiobacteraeota bacterium]|nr:hypothetical protein [Candidatus Eremiobacteraeota bacterium]